MNCQNHPDVPATAYCRTCGKPVCNECRRDAYGTVFCSEHVPAPAATASPATPNPYAQQAAPLPPPAQAGYPQTSVSPGLAFALGWIPGVGAIYNGQYAKGLVHAVIFGILVSILDSEPRGLEAVFGMGLAAWMFYMAFEAYHTARKRKAGEPVDDYSSLVNFRAGGQIPVAGIALILLGIVLLLHTLGLLDFEYVARYWPVLLIAGGAYMLYIRFFGRKEVGHEKQ